MPKTKAYYNLKTRPRKPGDPVGPLLTFYTITKFDVDLNPTGDSYTLRVSPGAVVCECPAAHKQVCRHRTMFPIFQSNQAVNTTNFYDFDNGKWYDPHLAT